jgi:hypothetical protein
MNSVRNSSVPSRNVLESEGFRENKIIKSRSVNLINLVSVPLRIEND